MQKQPSTRKAALNLDYTPRNSHPFRNMKMNSTRLLRSRQSGFTLLEIMLVVTLIGLLLGAGIYYMKGNVEHGRYVRVMSDSQALASSLKLYEAMNGFYPTTAQGLDALVNKPTTEPVPRNWRPFLDQELVDPWGNPYYYAFPAKRSDQKYDVFSAGPDRQPETTDDIGNWDDVGTESAAPQS